MTAKNRKKSTRKAKRAVSPRRRILVWCGAILGALLLAVLLVAWLIFSPYRDFSAPQLGEPHYLLLRRLATEVRNNRRLKEATIRFSPQETNRLLDIIRHSSQFVPDDRVPPPRHFMLNYRDDGGVFVSAPVRVAGKWCFGGNIYASGVLFFEKQGDEIVADVPKFRVGRVDMPLPGGLDGVYPAWKKQLKKSLPKEFMTSVKSLYPERDGTVVLVYYPQELRRPLKKKLSDIESRCSGELKMPLNQLIKSL